MHVGKSALEAGMYFLPLDLRQPRARLESMLMMAGAELLIAPRDFCIENFPVPVWTLEAGEIHPAELWQKKKQLRQ